MRKYVEKYPKEFLKEKLCMNFFRNYLNKNQSRTFAGISVEIPRNIPSGISKEFRRGVVILGAVSGEFPSSIFRRLFKGNPGRKSDAIRGKLSMGILGHISEENSNKIIEKTIEDLRRKTGEFPGRYCYENFGEMYKHFIKKKNTLEDFLNQSKGMAELLRKSFSKYKISTKKVLKETLKEFVKKILKEFIKRTMEDFGSIPQEVWKGIPMIFLKKLWLKCQMSNVSPTKIFERIPGGNFKRIHGRFSNEIDGIISRGTSLDNFLSEGVFEEMLVIVSKRIH